MAVVAHYLDKDFNNRTMLIVLRRLFGPHSGANMAETLLDVIEALRALETSSVCIKTHFIGLDSKGYNNGLV